MSFLFVYGTLRSGSLHPVAIFLHKHARWIGFGTMAGRMFDLGDYPGAVYLPDARTVVTGEVLQLKKPEIVLPVLDDYEGIGPGYSQPHEYKRVLCPVRTNDQDLTCWVYLYNLTPPDYTRSEVVWEN